MRRRSSECFGESCVNISSILNNIAIYFGSGRIFFAKFVSVVAFLPEVQKSSHTFLMHVFELRVVFVKFFMRIDWVV